MASSWASDEDIDEALSMEEALQAENNPHAFAGVVNWQQGGFSSGWKQEVKTERVGSARGPHQFSELEMLVQQSAAEPAMLGLKATSPATDENSASHQEQQPLQDLGGFLAEHTMEVERTREEAAGLPSLSTSAARSPVEVLSKRFADLCVVSPAASRATVSHCVMPALAQSKVTLHGVEVLFPFHEGPMQPQWQLMERTLDALRDSKHAVLESPTGTGKTVAMLCAVLAWQQRERLSFGRHRQVLYLSRTHAQLRQVVAELRKTPYRPKIAVLGSRESGLCIHPEVVEVAHVAGNQASVRSTCRKLRQCGSCSFHQRLAQPGYAEDAVRELRGEVLWDIEDAANFGQSAGGCPYYTAHALASHAELVLCPYNYVFDPGVRRSAGSRSLNLTGKVIVVDEAHNIEGVCRDAGSVNVTMDHLQAVLSSLKRLGVSEPLLPQAPARANAAAGVQRSANPPASQELGGFLTGAQLPPARTQLREEALLRAQGEGNEGGGHARLPQKLVGPLRSLASLFSRLASFLSGTRDAELHAPHMPPHQQVQALLRRLGLLDEPLLRVDPQRRPADGSSDLVRGESLLQELQRYSVASNPGGTSCAVFELAASLLSRLGAAVARPDLYAAYLHPPDKACLSFWLMAPEGTLASLAHAAHSLLLMSGTLAPVGASLADLGPGLLQRAAPPLETGHVISRQALTTLVVSTSGTTKLECNFKNWKSRLFLEAIGRCLSSLANSIPAGILVFLPNYEVLERCIEAWRTSGTKRSRGAVERVMAGAGAPSGRTVWQDLLAAKGTIVVEPRPQAGQNGGEAHWGMDSGIGQSSRAAQAFHQAKGEFEDAVRTSGQALLLAVYRGRMSEGVSFEDDFARGVVCIGIPFPALKDEKLVQKRLSNNYWQQMGMGLVTGDAWYEMRALQAVAQALGRCIRHPQDFGALVLLDSRWMELGKAAGLPKWLQPFLEDCADSAAACTKLVEHFRAISAKAPPSTAGLGGPTVVPSATPTQPQVKAEPVQEEMAIGCSGMATAEALMLKEEKKEEDSDDDATGIVKVEKLDVAAMVTSGVAAQSTSTEQLEPRKGLWGKLRLERTSLTPIDLE
mmetsp:Transcript_563/g.1795  ORF Transcript_563/g.1795 Transcript_563/m.1795 type:complete len:1088 (-) Transcript_563:24-3287(-)